MPPPTKTSEPSDTLTALEAALRDPHYGGSEHLFEWLDKMAELVARCRAEIDRLQAEADHWAALHCVADGEINAHIKQLHDLRAERDSLRAALDAKAGVQP